MQGQMVGQESYSTCPDRKVGPFSGGAVPWKAAVNIWFPFRFLFQFRYSFSRTALCTARDDPDSRADCDRLDLFTVGNKRSGDGLHLVCTRATVWKNASVKTVYLICLHTICIWSLPPSLLRFMKMFSCLWKCKHFSCKIPNFLNSK